MNSGTARYGREFPKEKITHSKNRSMTQAEIFQMAERGNAGAIEHAKNLAYDNTYGKGIHPESVEKMKKTLTLLLLAKKQLSKIPNAVELIEEALTASKLQP